MLSKITYLFSFIFHRKDAQLRSSLKRLLGFYPINMALYKQAFRHSSSKNINNNERLEFLGDAVLGTVIGEYLFKLYPFKDEGFLTQLRSRIVNRQSLNAIALKIGLNQHLEVNLTKDEKVKSSAYGDAFEALIGAIFLDKGFNVAKQFVFSKIIKLHVDIDELEQNDTDYKTQLQILTQKKHQKLEYRVMEEKYSGKDRIYIVQVFIDDKGYVAFQHYSKKHAEQKAAQLTLEQLQIV